MKTKNFFRYFPARQTLSTGLALTLLVTGPAAPWLESSSMPQTLWAERREQRLNQSKSSSPVFPVSRPAGLQIDKELGFATHSYHPFANDVLSKRNRTNQIPIILHFQEVHGNPSAQQNLATLLPNLSRQFLRTGTTQPLLITVEGAWGPLKTEWFRTLPDTNYRDTLAQIFLQTGWMTGEEFLAATNDDLNVHVVGVEDPILFEENTRALHETDNERLAMGHLLGTYFSPLKQGGDAVLPPNVSRLIKLKDRFENGKLNVIAYLRGLDSAGPGPWPREDFPALTDLIKSAQWDQRADIREARGRVEQSLSQGKHSSPTPQDLELLASVINQTTPMNPERIWQDLRRLEKSLINTNIASLPLHQRKETEDFLRLKEWLNLQENLWSLTMTPEDWESLQTLERHMSWTSFQRNLTRLARAHQIQLPPDSQRMKLNALAESTQNRLMDFYRLAHRRDRAMAIRTTELARSEGDGFAALVTGGFHSHGIRRWLRWTPAHYVEISPRFTGPHTLRDASRFTLNSERIPIPSLVAAITLLHHPERALSLKKHVAGTLRTPQIIDSEGTRHLAGFANTRKGPIPFLLGGTEEEPRLTEGREALSALRASLLAQGSSDRDQSLMEALNILLSPYPRRTAFQSFLARTSVRAGQTAHTILTQIQTFFPEESSLRPSLLKGPMAEVFFGGLKTMFYFLPPHKNEAGDRTPEGDPTPEKLMKNALTLVRNNSFPEAEQTLRRLHAVDSNDRWSGEFFRQLSPQERTNAQGKLSPLVWGAALNGHFTRLFEEHTAFLTNQFHGAEEIERKATAVLKQAAAAELEKAATTESERSVAGELKRAANAELERAGGNTLPTLQDHFHSAQLALTMFEMNTRSPAPPGDSPHATQSLLHNQAQLSRSADKNSWGKIHKQLEALSRMTTVDPQKAQALADVIKAEKNWLSVRLGSFAHPHLTANPAKALWFADEFLLPSVYGEYRKFYENAPPAAQKLRRQWEARRATTRERTLGVLTDLSGRGEIKESEELSNHPAFTTAIQRAIQVLPQGEATVRIQHPWPQTRLPLEQGLAQHVRNGKGLTIQRKLYRVNFGEIKRTMEGNEHIPQRLTTLLQTVGEAGGNAVVIDQDEWETLFPNSPNALAEAVQALRRQERDNGITGAERTPIILVGTEGNRDPLADLSGTTVPRIIVEASNDLVKTLLEALAKDVLARGLECPPLLLTQLERAIQEGQMDFPMAEGLLDRAGARARARGPRTSGLIKMTPEDMEKERLGLPPFEQLSLWRQAGIALHAMAENARNELQRNLNELRRTTSSNKNHAPLMAFLRHFLALRFLWPREPTSGTLDNRSNRSVEEQAALLKKWRGMRKAFRDELDRTITGQTELKTELERTYLLHDFEQWGNPNPDPADMVLMEGPPGTGKTTIGQALARASGRKFIEINAGGTVDPKRWKGLQRTFVGSQPSEITRQLEAAGTEDVLILIDEVDKMSRDSLDALTDFLDKRQEYHDTYLGSTLRYRRPRVRVILTANAIDETIFPDHLLSRLKRTFTRRYTDKELIAIGLDHVFPETLRATDYENDRVTVADQASVIQTIVSDYCPTNDVRDLQKTLRRVMAQAYHEWLTTTGSGQPAPPVVVDPGFVRRILGVATHPVEAVPPHSIVGQVNSLAANDSGGIVKPVQAYFRSLPAEEDAELIVTGLMHPDMKDSAQRAVLATQQALESDTTPQGRTHFHIPGEFQKSGPSAGLAFLTALYSERTGWPVKSGVAMTGEISPTGVAQRIGALDKKLTAALQAGVNTVFLPAGNITELREALARNEHLRGRVDENDQSRLYISNKQGTNLPPLSPELRPIETSSEGQWIQGARSAMDQFLKTNPLLAPPLTCVLVHHGYEILNQAIERPEGVPPLKIPPQFQSISTSERPVEDAPPSSPKTAEQTGGDQETLPAHPKGEDTPVRQQPIENSPDRVHQLVFQTKPDERISSLKALLDTGKQEEARLVLAVLHTLASIEDPSLGKTLKALPSWMDRLSQAAKPSDLQALGVVFTRSRELVFNIELENFQSKTTKESWLHPTPTTAGDIAREVRNTLTRMIALAKSIQNQIQGDVNRKNDVVYFNFVSTYLTQLFADLPPESSQSLSFEESEALVKVIGLYIKFMRHQYQDFSRRAGSLAGTEKTKEFPFITEVTDREQRLILANWMAHWEHARPTHEVAQVAMAALAETALRNQLRAGDLIDHTPHADQRDVSDTERGAFHAAAEEMGRRLTTAGARSAMFHAPTPEIAIRFLQTTAHYFQSNSPFPDQQAQRVLSITFPNTVGDADELLARLKIIVTNTRAVGDVVLAIDLGEFSRHFNQDLTTPTAFLLEMAQTRAGPQGELAPLPLLFYGKEESHLALSDTSLTYDRAVQSHPTLPSQPGNFLADWLIGQVANRVGSHVKFEDTAKTSLAELLNKESDLDLNLILSGLVGLATSADRESGAPLNALEVNRAIGDSLVAAEKEPSTIPEYRNAARRIPDPQARRRLLTEISRLSQRSPGSSDYQMLTNWIEAILAWPWREGPLPLVTPDQLPELVKKAAEKLDANIYGMKDIKNEIILHYELYLHQLSQGREPEMPVIAFSGPPGTAKTLLARMIGDIFGLPSEVIACSGVDDSRHFIGFFRTYTSSEEGALVKAYRKMQSKEVVLIFDEMDKRRTGGHFGDPLNALTRFFDPKYRQLTDDFLEQTLSVKETLAIITMNREESIPSHLLSRIIVLKVQEPTREEKIGMAQHILLPRLLKSKGFLPETKGETESAQILPVLIENPKALVTRLVDEHLAPRDDARKIEQALNQLLDSAFGDYVDTGVPVRLTQKSLEEYLGPSRQSQGIRPGSIDPVEIGRLKIPVQESALLTAHAAKRPGTKWKLQLPLALGDKDGRSNTLADTARIAWEVALASVLKRFPTLTPGTVYLHVDNNDARPDLHGLGFAGFGMTASLVSAMLGKPLPPQTTLGGAVDLKGNVLPLDVNEQGLLERKILRAAGEGNQTFYLPAGETTRQQLETTMRRHALLRGILIENGTAELTLVGAPGPMDSSDLSETGKRKKEEADLWNRTLESLPAKAKLAGIETSNGKIPFDQFQEFQESGPDSAPPQIDTITLKGSEEDLIKFITDNEALRSTPLSRYVLVHTVDEALTNLFPTTTEDTPSPPHENGVGSTLKSLAFGVATALTLMGTVAPSPAPAAPLIEPPHLEASPFFSGSITSPNQTLAAIGVLGQNEHPGSPLNLLARHVEETPAATLTPTLVDQVADQMSALPSPRTDSDTSQPEWGEAWGMVSNFINRRPRRVISAASRNKTDRTSARTKDYYASLGMALRTPANKRHLVLVDWGMVVSRPEEVEKLLSRMSENRNQTPEIAFLDSEGTAKQMEEDLSQAGLGQWATSHLVDRTGLEQAGALSATGQVDLTKVEAFLQTVLQKRGRSPAPLTQVVVDPINARRYLGEVVQLLMDVNEVVLQGTPAIQFLKTLGHDTTHPIRTPTMAYDPHTRTLRLQAQSIGPSALTNFGKTLLLIDSQA